MPRNASYTPTPSDQDEAVAAKLVFGEKVRSLMNNLSMSQSDLARASGLKRDSISTYVRGKAWPDPQNLRKLANALNVTPRDLVPGMSEIAESRLQTAASSPAHVGVQMEMVRAGFYRLRFDQVVPFEDATTILGILNKAKK